MREQRVLSPIRRPGIMHGDLCAERGRQYIRNDYIKYVEIH